MIKHISPETVRSVIQKVDGITYTGRLPYSQKGKIFFEDRYTAIINHFPSLPKKSVGLEVGLSGGILALLLQEVFAPKKLFAVEHPISIKSYDTRFLQLMKNANITVYPADLTKPHFFKDASTFDFISFCDVMEHLVPADLPGVFAQLFDLLKPNGYLLLNTPNIASLLKRLNLLRGKNPIEFDVSFHEKATYGHIREYTLQEVRSVLSQAGFAIVTESYFQIDAKRHIFTQLEDTVSKLYPPFANSIFVVVQKRTVLPKKH